MPLAPTEKRQREVDRLVNTFRGKKDYLGFAQKDFNKLVRLRAVYKSWLLGGDLWHDCVTCEKPLPYGNDKKAGLETMDAGHYRGVKATLIRFDPTNLHPQCCRCNQHDSGNRDAYREFIRATYGQGELDRLDCLANVPFQWPKEVLASLVLDWRAEIRSLEKQWGIR